MEVFLFQDLERSRHSDTMAVLQLHVLCVMKQFPRVGNIGRSVAEGYVSMALMPNHSKLTQFEVNGSFSVSRLGEVSSLGYNGCSTVARIMRDEAISAGRKHWA
mmetsp:Transcript_4472/g.5943  ORF Transcript_4472/g.5943 Transcript_4472/m.5943 type:complete len:104 (-) Transcript_4472:11-322(-)